MRQSISKCLILCLLLLSPEVWASQERTCESTESPVVGILVQDFLGNFKSYRLNRTFIAATYVKFIESYGGRVVPLFTDQNEEYYDRILNQINGVVLPGGDQDTINSSFTRTASIVYKHAIESSKQGFYFPVWGVCQGLEVLAYLTAGQDPLHSCVAADYATPLDFSLSLKDLNDKTKLFRSLSPELHHQMRSSPVAFQWHNLCLLKGTYLRTPALRQFYRILATSTDRRSVEYVSAIESIQHPIYGIMFHPEEVMFSFEVKMNHTSVPHTNESLNSAHYFSNFFVNECRKSSNRMQLKTLQRNIIYNYIPEHTSDSLEPYDLMYFFENSDYTYLYLDEFSPATSLQA